MSATYKCSKCDLTGSSKNIHTRSLFTDDQIASMMRNIINVETKHNDKGSRVTTFEFPFNDISNSNEPDDVLEIECMKMVRDISDEVLTHWLCDHDWKQTGGKELESSW
jgi:hypothetical protein